MTAGLLAVMDAAFRTVRGTLEGPRDGEMEEARATAEGLIATVKDAEQFIVYLLTHAPELPDENGVVRRLRAIHARAKGRQS